MWKVVTTMVFAFWFTTWQYTHGVGTVGPFKEKAFCEAQAQALKDMWSKLLPNKAWYISDCFEGSLQIITS